MLSLAGKLKAWASDRRGVAAIEFAFIAPLMVLFYFGLVELCQAIIAERKTNHVASAIGDLVAQAESTTTSEVSDIFSIGKTIMAPFNTSSLTVKVSDVLMVNNKPTVQWSQGSGVKPSKKGDIVTLPTGMTLNNGDGLIISEVTYQYDSVFHYVLPNALPYKEAFYLRPRRSSDVPCADCPTS